MFEKQLWGNPNCHWFYPVASASRLALWSEAFTLQRVSGWCIIGLIRILPTISAMLAGPTRQSVSSPAACRRTRYENDV